MHFEEIQGSSKMPIYSKPAQSEIQPNKIFEKIYMLVSALLFGHDLHDLPCFNNLSPSWTTDRYGFVSFK